MCCTERYAVRHFQRNTFQTLQPTAPGGGVKARGGGGGIKAIQMPGENIRMDQWHCVFVDENDRAFGAAPSTGARPGTTGACHGITGASAGPTGALPGTT